MTARTKRCTAAVRDGRLAKAKVFMEAERLLGQIDKKLARDLGTLLSMKPMAAYSHVTMTGTHLKRAQRAARHLVDAASLVNS